MKPTNYRPEEVSRKLPQILKKVRGGTFEVDKNYKEDHSR